MRLFESKKISRLSESSLPRMNKHEYLLKHFFDFPERQLKALLQQVTLQTGFDCNGFESFEMLTKGDEPFIENIGFLARFSDPLGVIPVEGILNHKIGEIEFSIWSKNLTLKLR
jgi:hypothetical protein